MSVADMGVDGEALDYDAASDAAPADVKNPAPWWVGSPSGPARSDSSTSSDVFSSPGSQSLVQKRKSLSGRKKKQLTQMFNKGLEDESCAAILGVDINSVREFREHISAGDVPSGDEALELTNREQEQLRQMFARQVTPGSCAEILQIDVASVKEFKTRAERSQLSSALANVKVYSVQAANYAKATACEPAFQVSAAVAVAGATAGAVTGGGAGTIVGGFVGATAGVGPAFLTFGMSIPISTTIGSGIGLCFGVVSGGTVGAVAGGASGYAGFKYRRELGEMRAALVGKARKVAETLRPGVAKALQKLHPHNAVVAVAG